MGWSLLISCARATRGLGRPSLDARTMGARQAAPPILEEKDKRAIWQTAFHRHGQPTMET